MPKHDFLKYFPFDKIRDEQKAAIAFAIDAYESGKKCVILEMGTGTGKSATGIAIARYMEMHGQVVKDDEGMPFTGAYVITTQKILQDQYINDFGPKSRGLLRTIKSATNYCCKFYKDQSCGESKRLLAKLGKQLAGTEFEKQCKGNGCHYSLEKQDFIESPISITNFSYFLSETTYSGKLMPRALLIVDECHNTETELGKFIEVTFSEKFARDVLKCKVPKLDSQEAVVEWIRTGYHRAVAKYVKDLEKNMAKLKGDIEGYGSFSKQYEMLENHISKLEKFLQVYNVSNWVMNIAYPMDGNKRGARKFEFKPIDVSPFATASLLRFGCRVLMMSATIVDHEVFCSSLGLNIEDVAFLRIPSPFPVENRPIHYLPVGSMGRDHIDATLPKMVEVVRLLLAQHAEDKGIIHAVNYRVAKFLQEHLKSDRILTHDSTNRDEVLKRHIESTEPTVLLSPSMMEGVDLYDDLSRFQIVCKVPFPYLGDLVVKKRMERNKNWYPYRTAKTVIQSFGRSIRNAEDHAVSYILDSDWERFYSRNGNMFPEEFKASIVR